MTRPRAALIDAHVHFHACFDPGRFLDGAHANFSREAAKLGLGGDFAGFLLLTETANASWFEHLQRHADGASPVAPGWTARATAHHCQLGLNGPDGAQLNVVSGYQVLTSENLEVLALGTGGRPPDGQPIEHVVPRVREAGGIPVIPWGFGKWLGRRGRRVRSLLETASPGDFFLGDNSNRMAGVPEPELFRQAQHGGIRVLPGTDPLPFPREATRAGGAGLLIECEEAGSWPAVRAGIMRQERIVAFGRLERPWSFAANQIAMQLHKRLEPFREPS